MPSDPTKTGYTFGGWYTASGSSGTEFTASTQVTANITVYAKWTSISYTVTFNADGGSPATQTRTVSYGSSVGTSDMPSDPTKTGYTFGGWYTASGGSGTEFTASTQVTANITVYAKWVYTVTFNADGGSPATQTRTVSYGSNVGSSNMPSGPTKTGYTFGGWYTATGGSGTEFTASTQVTASITVYAKWTTAQVPSNLSLNDALTWISNNAVEGGAYTVTLNTNEIIGPKTLSYGGKNVSVTLQGATSERMVILNANGSLFTVESKVTLTLDANVTLLGRSSNTASLVKVNSGGKLTMKTGSNITGNTVSSDYYGRSYGGGVYISGTFIMDGGEISDNSCGTSSGNDSYGCGIYISGGTFTMNGGKISGNFAYLYSDSVYGGGVYVSDGTFTMNGGEISGNSASSSYSSASTSGGGVYVSDGAFTMNGGEISGNSAASSSSGSRTSGGGVYVNGTFTMNGGEISENTANGYYASGGGVYVGNTFAMSGGKISGNSASGRMHGDSYYSGHFYCGGGGVYMSSGTFTMEGGEISGNSASASYDYAFGGGVYVGSGTFIKMQDAVIYGSNAESTLKNTAVSGDSYGHVIYVDSSPAKKRNTTAGAGVTLNSSLSGGWE
jgi:uncharacterized repeat protein (TIGR02543 family)